MKKKILALVLCLALAMAAIGGTLAYFTDTDSADNQFVVGNVDIRLNENQGDSDWAGTEDYMSWLEDQIIVPGESVDKIVTVENLDREDAYVRVTVVVPADMTATVNSPEGWTMTEKYDNVYVFVGKVAAGQESPALLQSVKLNEDVTNQGKISEYHIPVLAEAVQTTGFETADAALATLATENVRNYIDKYVQNDAFAALKSGDIVTLAAETKLPQDLNDGVVLIGGEESATAVTLGGEAAPQQDAKFLNTSGSTFVNLKFTDRVAVKGDATFVNCTFEKGLWMMDVSGNVSLVNCTIEGASSEVDLLIDGSNEGNANFGRVIVKGCTINGSTAIAGATSALYENCTFGAEGWSWKQIRINCPTTIEACTGADSIANGGNHALRVIPADTTDGE